MRASVREHGLGALDGEAVAAVRLEPARADEKEAALAYLAYVARAVRGRSMTGADEAVERLRAVARTDSGEPIDDVVVAAGSRERYFDGQELLSFAALPDLRVHAEQIDRLVTELSDTE